WSLQDAINSACAVSTLSGEPQTVYVMPGVYAGPINVPGGRVTLAAAVPGTVRIDGPITVSTGVGGNVMFVDLECSAQFTAVSTTFGVGGVFTLQRCTVRSELGAAVALDGSAGGSASMFGSTIVPGAGSAGVQSVGGVSFNSGLSIMNSTVGPSPFSPSFSGRSLSLQRTDLGPCDGTTFNAPVELAASTASIHRATFRTGTGAVLTLDAASTAVMTHCTVDTPTDPCMTAPTLGSLRVGSLAYLSAGDTLPATATLLDVDAGLHVPRTDRPAAITAPYTFTVTPSLLDSPPMSVSSTSLVPNLNADMLDGLHAAAFMSAGATLGGDCSGAIGAVSVDRIKGRSVSDATPTEGQVLKFTGGTWAPGPDAGAAYVQGPGISISGGTISVATLGVTSGMLAPDSVNGSTVADGTISSADLQFDTASLTRVSGGRMTVDGLSVVVGPPSGALSDFSVRAFDPARSAVALSHADPFTLKPTLTAEGSGRNTWCTEVRVTDPAGNQPALRASSVSLSPAASALVAEIPAGPGSAIVGINPGAGFAVFGQGRLGSTGPKPFHIDHPLDPANRFLTHYAAEGPQPLNLYRGTVLCDADGRAQVVLPSYYESINTDPQYQLTCVGGFAPVFIESEIADGRFVIAGGRPGLKVCWQVTAARNDAYIRAYGAPVETDKPAEFRGRYLHPELVGRPAGEGIFRPASDRQNPVAQRP
ncbi:MAG: hypothetical protein JNJ48_01380, partial [Phycisphaerae bacterium]|nr:hypothetical protein [Phycisphaerae bacterium]